MNKKMRSRVPIPTEAKTSISLAQIPGFTKIADLVQLLAGVQKPSLNARQISKPETGLVAGSNPLLLLRADRTSTLTVLKTLDRLSFYQNYGSSLRDMSSFLASRANHIASSLRHTLLGLAPTETTDSSASCIRAYKRVDRQQREFQLGFCEYTCRSKR